MSTYAPMMRVILNQKNNYDEIRIMNKYELKSYIREIRNIQKIIMKGNYTEKKRILSSQVIYAKNRLRLI